VLHNEILFSGFKRPLVSQIKRLQTAQNLCPNLNQAIAIIIDAAFSRLRISSPLLCVVAN
jgi:hypothetical protein